VPPEVVGVRPLRQRVFDRIRAAGLISRIDLAKELAISPASVSSITSELIERGLIREDAARPADLARGRPPVALGISPGAGAVAGIKLSDHTHSAIVLDFAGQTLGQASLPSRGQVQSLSGIADSAAAILTLAAENAGLSPGALAAVGVGLPGVMDSETGQVLWSPIIDEPGGALGPMLSERIGRPVQIDNDANMVTLAELWFGTGRNLPDFAVVTIEYGVGMGLVLNHSLYRGAMGHGMEIGHTKVQLDGALCRCGQRGCLEAYVADYALVREASIALNWGNRTHSPSVMLETLYDQAKGGNDTARAIFDRAGRYLAVGLANIVNLFDPRRIILSGERMRYDYLYAEEVLAEMVNLTLKTGRKPPVIEINAWGDLVWARGAAALALDRATADMLAGTQAAA
jgi:predicted NBD/HSP70 family sugar kinase